MSEPITPRRIVLTVLFTVWLALQAMVLGLTPAWGYFVPHTHLTRGIVTQTDWDAHMQEHLRGDAPVASTFGKLPNTKPNKTIVGSIPDSGNALSVFNGWDVTLTDTQVRLTAPNALSAPLNAARFHRIDMVYAPLDPPPNL